MNNNHEHTMMPGLYDNEFFDFEAASTTVPSNGHEASSINDVLDFQAFSSSRLGNPPALPYSPPADLNNNISQTATTRTSEELRFIPLTESEIESILAIRASKERDRSFGPILVRERKPDHIAREQAQTEGSFHLHNDAPVRLQADNLGVELREGTLVGGPEALKQFQYPAVLGAPSALDSRIRNGGTSSISQATNIDGLTSTDVSMPDQVEKPSQQPFGQPHSWSHGRRCSWTGCHSKAVFKNQYSLNSHIENVHRNPLVCSVTTCSHKTPFSRKTDLKRHERSVHSLDRSFVCTVPSCDAHIKEFSRKDHLRKHMRERHDNYFCPLHHCPRGSKDSFAKPEDLAQHINMDHGEFECAVKACATGPASRFTQDSLGHHLRNQHGIYEFGATILITGYRMRLEQSKTVTEVHLAKAAFTDCKICGTPNGSAAQM